jgi:methionyl-tRNA formyltransferase
MNTPNPLRILFAGTPGFAVVPLEELANAGFRPTDALTQPDRPAGRGREQRASPVKQAALALDIPVHQPASLRSPAARGLVESLAPDLMVVVAYGLLLPEAILRIPKFGCWNIHASLLPRWRGAAPIQRAIEAGDAETGVSIMHMDAGLDTGPVIHQQSISLLGNETGGSLHDQLAVLGAKTLLNCVRRLANGETLPTTKQADHGVTYAAKLEKSEAEIDWNAPAEILERRIRAFNPWPVAWSMIGQERTRIWRATVVERKSSAVPGTIVGSGREGIDVATGSRILRLLELQPPGKRRMSASDYLNARPLPARLAASA